MLNEAKDALSLLFSKKKGRGAQVVANDDLGRANIMLAGKTGVGKSTLINAVFREGFAITGIGAPVTQRSQLYEKDGLPLSIYDMRGLELDAAASKDIRAEMKKLIKDSLKTQARDDDIHLMWYCIASSGHRVEAFELDFIRDLAKQIDVIVVLTHCEHPDQTRQLMAHIENVRDQGDLPIKGIVPVLAIDQVVNGLVVQPRFGLKELTDLSYELLPDAQKRTFAAAQKLSDDLRRKAAISAISLASAAAAAAGAIPIPIADAAVLVPIQLTMFKGIANVYGVKFGRDDFTKLVATLVPAAAVKGGRAAVASLLKLVPGVGGAVAVVSGAVAATLTATLGTAFQTALEHRINEVDLQGTLPDGFDLDMKKALGRLG